MLAFGYYFGYIISFSPKVSPQKAPSCDKDKHKQIYTFRTACSSFTLHHIVYIAVKLWQAKGVWQAKGETINYINITHNMYVIDIKL